MIAFSASEMMRDLRSGPATIRSRASWNSDIPMTFLLRRAARMAASLTRLARSAPEERRVEDVGPVGRGDDDDVGVGVEAVHLDEDLVERLLALVVTATEARAALATDGVDLVDEDDARRVALGLVEQVADAAGADADEHLDELRAGDAEERHAGFTRDR